MGNARMSKTRSIPHALRVPVVISASISHRPERRVADILLQRRNLAFRAKRAAEPGQSVHQIHQAGRFRYLRGTSFLVPAWRGQTTRLQGRLVLKVVRAPRVEAGSIWRPGAYDQDRTSELSPSQRRIEFDRCGKCVRAKTAYLFPPPSFS